MTQQISEEQRGELARYQAGVRSQLARAEQERNQARTWDRWYGGRGGQTKAGLGTALALFGGVLGIAIALGVGAQALMMSGNRELAAVAMLLAPIGVPAVVLTALVGYTVWYYGGKRRERIADTPPGSVATCPNCGAANALGPGQVLERCAYCGVALMPSTTMMAQALNGVEAVRLAAELERYRAERRGMATAIRSSAGAFVPYIVLGSFLPITVGGGIVFTVDAIATGKFEPGLVVLWAIGAVNAWLIGLVYLWRRVWTDRFRRLAALASAPFPNRALDFDGFIGWLNAYWAGPIPLTEIFAGTHFHAVSLALGPYPGLLVLNPKPLADGYPGYLALYLAAQIPAVRAGRDVDLATVAPQRASIEALGFRVTCDSAGLRAHATERVARRFANRVDGGQVLAHVATTLHGMAWALSAEVVQLPPE